MNSYLPSDWQEIALEDCGQWYSGGTPNTSNPEYWNGDIPWISASSLKKFFITDSGRKVTELGVQNGTRLVPKNSILFVVRGMSLRTEFRVGIACQSVAFGQDCKAIIVDDGIDPLYLAYGIVQKSHRIIGLADEASHGTKRLQTGLVGGIKIPVPSILEQRKIAAVLSTWDEAIRLTEELIAAKQQRKKGLMQRLLTGQVRFPGFEERPWREASLGEFFEEFSIKNVNGDELTVLSCSKIYGIVPQTVIFDKRVASTDTARYKIVERGDLVYDPMLLWDASIGFVDSVDEGVISPAYNTFKFRSDSSAVKRYFQYLFKSYLFRHYYKVISQGTNVRRRKAPSEAFLGLAFPFPTSVEEQEQITAVLLASDREIELLGQKLEALQEQKKGLMQRLLTGQVRVKAN